MRTTGKIIAEFVGVFLIGGIAGALVMNSYTDTVMASFMTKAADKPDAIVARINKKYADEYHFSADEIAKIQPQVKDFAQRLSQVRHQFGLDIIATLDNYHQQVAAQLTAEHRAVYEKAIAERRKSLGPVLLPDGATAGQGQQ